MVAVITLTLLTWPDRAPNIITSSQSLFYQPARRSPGDRELRGPVWLITMATEGGRLTQCAAGQFVVLDVHRHQVSCTCAVSFEQQKLSEMHKTTIDIRNCKFM